MIRSLLFVYFFMTVGITLSLAQSDAPLGQASSFVVLAKTAIINHGETGLMGNVGVSPAGSISGEELIDLTGGRFEINTSASASALEDANTAYNHLSAMAPNETLPLPILGGRSLTPGTYRIGGNATLKGTLTLDGLDQSNALFVIQIDGNLYSDPISSNIRLINGAQAKNVFWVMTGGVELQSNTLFQGTLLAKGDIILHTSVNGAGRAISLEGKVVLNTNNVVVPSDVLPDLSISKTAPDNSYRVGDRITYTIVVRNTGVGTAFGVKVTENFPAALRYVPGSAVYTEGEFNESDLTWELSFLQFGESREIQLTFDIISAGEISNSVTVESNEKDPNQDDNDDDVIIVVPEVSSNLNVTKVATGAPYYVGGNVTYTITVTNTGPYDAKEVAVTEQLPAGLEFVSATPSGSYNSTTGIFTVGNLAVGSSATLTLVARITAPGKILNTVTAVPGGDVPDLTPGDNTDGEEIDVTCAPVASFGITGALEGYLCEGVNNAVFTATPIPGATYTFTLTGGLTQVSQTGNSVTVSAGATSGTVQVSVTDLCGNTFTASKEVKVLNRLATPTTITGPATLCQNSTGNAYSVADYGADATYTWVATGDLQITAGNNTPSVEVSAGLLGGSLTLVVSNECFETTPVTKVFTTTTLPTAPTTIDGNTTVCVGNQVTYSTPALARADSYQWSVPAGWTVVSGQGERTITFTVGNTTGEVNLSVAATNVCGTTSAVTIAVQVKEKPVAPAAIAGNTTVCAGTEAIYSVTAVPGATGHTWTPPAGWSVISGAGTAEVTFRVGAAGGNITVTADNGCGSSTATTVAVTVNDKPATPGAITGPAAVCAAGTGNTYSIAAVAGAISYIWSVPDGWTIASGQGTTSITVTAGTAAGTIKVKATNECGDSGERTYNSTINSVPAAPAAITGNTTVCAGTEATYSVTAVTGATAYTWALPVGWSIVRGEGTAQVTVQVGTAGGNVSVTADNSCGGSSAATKAVTVNDKLAAPAISGEAGACIGQRLTYTIPAVTGATGYAWTVPATWRLVNGQNTTSIEVEVGAEAGQVTVGVINGCGTGTAATLNVAPVLAPTESNSIVGNSAVCANGETVTYTLATVEAGVTYTWTVPADWTIVSGQETGIITVNTTATAGTISVVATNACGTAQSISKAVGITVPPVAPGTISDNSNVCDGLTYSITAMQGATGYIWTVPAGFTITSGQGTISIKVTADNPTATGEVTVAAMNGENGTCAGVTTSATIDASLADGQLKFPKAFSPNGDGKNDTWVIANLEKFATNEVVIFNRWGSEVYKTKNYQNDWSAGKLEQGTYFYKVRVTVCDGVVKEFTGYTTLFR